jgi:hypothetical protein
MILLSIQAKHFHLKNTGKGFQVLRKMIVREGEREVGTEDE